MAGLLAALVTLTNLWGSVSVETLGARIVSYVPAGGEEVVWNDSPMQLTDPAWAHGGIPTCWPWFGRKGNGAVHGTSWRREFREVSRSESPRRSELVLELTDPAARLEYRLTHGRTLRLEMWTYNLSDGEYRFSAAFHPYFRVSERDDIAARVGSGAPFDYRASPDDFVPVDTGSLTVSRVWDRGLARTLKLYFENATGVNVWNPGPELDCPGTIRNDGWRGFVAVEPMARGEGRTITLPQGACHVLKMAVEMQPTAAKPSLARPLKVVGVGASLEALRARLEPLGVALARAGAEVTLVSLCGVDAARYCQAQLRARELGLERLVFLDGEACVLEPTMAFRRRLTRLLRDLNPEVVLAHSPADYHPDLRAAAQLAQDSVCLMTDGRFAGESPASAQPPAVGIVSELVAGGFEFAAYGRSPTAAERESLASAAAGK